MSKSAKLERTDPKYWIFSIIGITLMFGFGYIPPIEPLTVVGMKLVGIFLGTLFLWTAVDLIWPSILAIVAFGTSGYCTMATAINTSLGSTTVWLQMMLMILAFAINSSGMGELIARWIITRKFLNGKPLLFTFVYLFGFFITSILAGTHASILLSWGIFYNIAEIVGYEKGNRYGKTMIIALLFVIMGGGLSMRPFQSYVLALCNTFSQATGVAVNYGIFMIVSFVINVALILLITLAIKYVFKCDLNKLKELDVDALRREDLPRPNFKQLSYVFAFLVLVAYVFLTMLLPKDWALAKVLKALTQEGLMGILIALLCIIRIKGEPLMDFIKCAKGGINWYCILMCASIVPIASALTSDATGVKPFLAPILTPIFGDMNGVLFLTIVVLVILVFTNIMSNIGIVMLLIPIVTPFIESSGISPQIMAIALIATTNMGIILPGASGLSSYLYSNEWLVAKDIYKYAGFYTVLYGIITIAVLLAFSPVF